MSSSSSIFQVQDLSRDNFENHFFVASVKKSSNNYRGDKSLKLRLCHLHQVYLGFRTSEKHSYLRENIDLGFGNNKRLSFNISGIHCVQVRNVPMFQVGTALTIMDQVNAKW